MLDAYAARPGAMQSFLKCLAMFASRCVLQQTHSRHTCQACILGMQRCNWFGTDGLMFWLDCKARATYLVCSVQHFQFCLTEKLCSWVANTADQVWCARSDRQQKDARINQFALHSGTCVNAAH